MLSILEHCEVIDLTHALHEGVPNWTGECGFHSRIEIDYEEGCRIVHYDLTAGIGTHMDAPSHFLPDGEHIADLETKNFVVPLCLIRVSSNKNPDILVSAEDIQNYEVEHGQIPFRSLVIADTGWAKYWEDSDRYRNVDSDGDMHFPGFSSQSVELLLQRNIVGVGIDTLSPDGGNTEFPVHHLLLNQGKYIIENVAHLDQIPPSGAWAIALPPKIYQGTESPCRMIALMSPH